MLHRLLPRALRMRLRRATNPLWMASFNRTQPFSGEWGFDRGTPVDRRYMEIFLERNSDSIRGRVLEIRSSDYTMRFGRGVTQSDVMDIDASNERATVVADLSRADEVASDSFDCFILTQTLQLIYDVNACVRHAHRMLRPGGVLLVTVPCISRIVPRYGLDTDYWRFTPASCKRMFGDVFGESRVVVETMGNVYGAAAFLHGLAVDELDIGKLDAHDPYYPVLVTVRAQKEDSPVR